MKILGLCALSCALLCVLVGGQAARADDDDPPVPSFKSDKGRETKEFVTKVGTVVVKAARSKPTKIELEKYEYTKVKPGRTELKVKMIYYGLVTKKKYNADIVVQLDSSDANKWEVLNIKYTDNSTNVLKANTKGVQELILKFNK